MAGRDIDLSVLTALQGFEITGTIGDALLGDNVKSLGDVNGDGLDDVIVAARQADEGGGQSGSAFVIFGQLGGYANVDVTTLAVDGYGFEIIGDSTYAYLGYGVGGGGDYNGDGLADILVGSHQADLPSNDGSVYVIYGSETGLDHDIDTAALDPADGTHIYGTDGSSDSIGTKVANIGDTNGDGYDDFVIGAQYDENAYVVYGKAGGLGTSMALTPTTVAGGSADGFVIQFPTASYHVHDVAGIGDINGDGLADIMLSQGDLGPSGEGTVYVLYGRSTASAGFTDLNTFNSTLGFKIIGDDAGDYTGYTISSAGDFDGDGHLDILISAHKNDSGDDAGAAWLIYGTGAAMADIDLSSPTTGTYTQFLGSTANDDFGRGVAMVGDLNGDGYDDIAFGASGSDLGGDGSGAVTVVYGGARLGDTFDIDALTSAQGFTVTGAASGDHLGANNAVWAAGDVNGDGVDDMILGASGADGGAGTGYVIYGGTETGFGGEVDVANLEDPYGVTILGENDGDELGRAVGGGGDFNGDGIDDIIVGVPKYDYLGVETGAALVLYGADDGSAGSTGFLIIGAALDDRAGFSVASAGDVNGDGVDDILVGAPTDTSTNGGGHAYLIYGVAGGRATVDLSAMSASDGITISGGGYTGVSVSAAGDVNNDGIDDFVVGASFDTTNGIYRNGAAHVFYGTASGLSDITLANVGDPATGFQIYGWDPQSGTGGSVSAAGDVNGDGIDDLIVGASVSDATGYHKGEAYVVFGTTGTRADVDTGDLDGSDGSNIVLTSADDYPSVGYSVSSAGDVNGDGFDDLIIGAKGIRYGDIYDGAAFVVYGNASGTATVELSGLDASTGFRINGPGDPSDGTNYGAGLSAHAGISVSSAGDLNGDGFDDIVVGAPGEQTYDPAIPGQAFVIWGAATNPGTMWLGDLDPLEGFVVEGETPRASFGCSVSEAGDVNGDGYDDLIVGAPREDEGGADAGAAYVIYGRAPSAPVHLIGDENDNRLTGGGYGDILEGRAGDDILDGGTGDDDMRGEEGDDTYIVDSSGDLITEAAGEGTDTVETALAAYSLGAIGHVENLTYTGSGDFTGSGNGLGNVITGGAGDDTLAGGDGDDTLVGGDGDDDLYGGDGDDRLLSGLGQDDMFGGAGDDTYVAHQGWDTITEAAGEGTDTVETAITMYTLGANVENLTFTDDSDHTGVGNDEANEITGHSGDDHLDGKAGADTLIGGAGDDTYVVDDAGDVTTEAAGEGTDEVQTALGAWTLGANLEKLTYTGTGSFLGTGNGLDNEIISGDGDDTLDGGAGADEMAGGTGHDIYVVDDLGDRISEEADEGNDQVRTGLSAYALGDYLERLTYTGTGDFDGTGNELSNRLDGGDGDDLLDGGALNDDMYGGLGDDTYLVDHMADEVYENAGAGTDTVRTSLLDYTLSANVENLEATSADDVTFTGNGENNTIRGGVGDDELHGEDGLDTLYGGGGDDWLDGGAGNDAMFGGTGDDIYWVFQSGDSVTEYEGEGTDLIVTNHIAYTLGDHVENLTMMSSEDFAGTGNGLDNQIVGNAGADHISGLAGDDRLRGGAQDDTLDGGDGVDTADYSGAEAVVVKLAKGKAKGGLTHGVDVLVSIENVTGGDGNDALTGDGEDNRLVGAGGNDTLLGKDGADVLVGGLGKDILDGGDGKDLADFSDADVDLAVLLTTTDKQQTGMGKDRLISIENVSGGSGNDALVGNGKANRLWGNEGDDKLTGNNGNDQLDGGLGDDVLNGGKGKDWAKFFSGADITVDLTNGDRQDTGEGNDKLRAIERVETGDGNDALTGDDANNRFVTGAGDDIVLAGLGDDLVDAGDGADNVDAGKGDDEVEAGAGDDVVTGAGGDDKLWLGDGNDIADGGKGKDVIWGGLGDDVMSGGSGADRFVFEDGFGADRITDFVTGEDTKKLEIKGDVVDMRPMDLALADLTLSEVAGATRIMVTATGDYVDLLGLALADFDVADDLWL